MKLYYLGFILIFALSSCKTVTPKSNNSNDMISIMSGEKVSFQATLQDEEFISFRKVDDISEPEITLVFNFKEMDKAIKYHINMIDPSGRSHQTSSCSTTAGGGSYESWGHPIPKIEITNVHFASEEEIGLCVY